MNAARGAMDWFADRRARWAVALTAVAALAGPAPTMAATPADRRRIGTYAKTLPVHALDHDPVSRSSVIAAAGCGRA
jgi:hypothetical protein